jgi:hypothetical protein
MKLKETPPEYVNPDKAKNGMCSPGFYSNHCILHIPPQVYAPLGKEGIRKIVEEFFKDSKIDQWFSGVECDSGYVIDLPPIKHSKSTMYDLIYRIEDAAEEIIDKQSPVNKKRERKKRVNGQGISKAERLSLIKRIHSSR